MKLRLLYFSNDKGEEYLYLTDHWDSDSDDFCEKGFHLQGDGEINLDAGLSALSLPLNRRLIAM